MNYDRPELLDRLAAEYVLGTLSVRARRRSQAATASPARGRLRWIAWERRLHPLASSVPPVTPTAATWQAIERRIGGEPRPARAPRWPAWLAPLLGVGLGVVATLAVVQLRPDRRPPLVDVAHP